jgi:hypothetical protein
VEEEEGGGQEGRGGDRVLAKVSVQDDALLHAALRQVGASGVLRDLQDMDPMLEDVQVRGDRWGVCVCVCSFLIGVLDCLFCVDWMVCLRGWLVDCSLTPVL